MAFVWRNPAELTGGAEEFGLSDTISSAWFNTAAHGNPRGTGPPALAVALQTTLRHELTAVFALLPTGIQGERGGMKRVDWVPFATGPPSAEKAAVFGGAGAVARNGYTTVEAALRERYCDFWLTVPARPP